jgi:hypothetical protein
MRFPAPRVAIVMRMGDALDLNRTRLFYVLAARRSWVADEDLSGRLEYR